MELVKYALLLLIVLLAACGSSSTAAVAVANQYQNDFAARSPLVDVREYGAKGDGIADDGPAVQKAIDYASSIGGGTVLIPSGTFLLKTVTASYYLLKTKDKVSVIGAGPSSILKAGPGLRTSTSGVCILYNHTEYISDLQIANLTIDYNGANNLVKAGWSGCAVVSRTGGNIANGVMVRKVNFKNSSGHHFLWFGLTSEDARNDRNSVTDCAFSECGLSISGNMVTDHSSVFMGSANSTVANNSFLNATQDYVATAIELHGDNTTAVNNTVMRYNHGLNLGGDSNSVNNVAITGNAFKSVVRGVVLWTWSNYTIDKLAISGNMVSVVDTEGTVYAPGGGIIYSGGFDSSAATSSNWSIFNNMIKPETVCTSTFAYSITGIEINPVKGLSITGNTISGMKAEGIRVAAVSGKAPSNVVIADNNISSCGYTASPSRNVGLFLVSNTATYLTTDVSVRGNVIKGGHYGSAMDMAYGVALNGSGQFEGLRIVDNVISGAVVFDMITPTNQTTASRPFITHVAEKTGTPWSLVRATWGSKWLDSSSGYQYDYCDITGTNGSPDGWSLINPGSAGSPAPVLPDKAQT